MLDDRDAQARGRLPDERRRADLARPHYLEVVDEEDGDLRRAEELLHLADVRALVAPRVPRVARLADPVRLVADERVEGPRLGAGEPVEVSELRGGSRADDAAKVLSERLRAGRMLGDEALGRQLGEQVHRDDGLAGAGAAVDQEDGLLGARLALADAPDDVVERDLLLVEEREHRLAPDHPRGVLEQALVRVVAPLHYLVENGQPVAAGQVLREIRGELVGLVAGVRGVLAE